MKMFALCLITSLFGTPGLFASQFTIEEMPEGGEVTIPRASTALSALTTSLKLSATDTPQTVSVVPVLLNGAKANGPVRLSIFDTKQERVKYVLVHPDVPFLYSFKGLSSITVKPDVSRSNAAEWSQIRLKWESDRPVTFTRNESITTPPTKTSAFGPKKPSNL